MYNFYFNNKKICKVLIVGYGLTGKSVYNFLDKFINISIDISHNDNEFINFSLDNYDLIVVSPGIPTNKIPYILLSKFKNKIVSDIDIFYDYMKNSKIKIIAITGSNGKSTVSSIINFTLNDMNYKSILIGNIGIPALNVVNKNFDYCIIEVSSFQIDLFNCIKFNLGCIINISPDHLDRYKNFNKYKQSKFNLAKFSNDFFIYDIDNNGIKYTGDYKIIKDSIYKNSKKILNIDDINIFGKHNLDNIIVALNIFNKLGLDINKSINSIKKFKGLDHRCKIVKKINGITYINDSKGTNVMATISAIKNITNSKNILLLLGGIAKGGDFSLMLKYLDKYVKYIYLYGIDKKYIESYIKKYCNYQICNNMKQAFNMANKKAEINDIILLSTACASFDEFKDYKERGETFKKFVAEL